MLNAYLELSSSPYSENCAQVGSDNYNDQSRIECKAYIQQLNRLFPSLPEGCNFGVKSFPHDFGSYREVCIIYPEKLENCLNDDNCDEDNTCENCQGMKLIYDIENNLPENWDNEAIAYLKENNAL